MTTQEIVSAPQKSIGLVPISPEQRAEGARVMRAKRESWKSLDLRQDFADAAWMQKNIREAGLRVPELQEPATAERLMKLCRRLGVHGTEFRDSVGLDAQGYLDRNPRLPLWAALAYVIELTGILERPKH